MEILNKTMIPEYVYPSGWWYLLCAIPFIIGLVVCAKTQKDGWIGFAFGGAFAVALLISGLNESTFKQQVPSDNYRYEVKLEENYPAAKLLDEYYVYERRGEIWVLENRR